MPEERQGINTKMMGDRSAESSKEQLLHVMEALHLPVLSDVCCQPQSVGAQGPQKRVGLQGVFPALGTAAGRADEEHHAV